MCQSGIIKPISIHALREEGDADLTQMPENLMISIHALREEGDVNTPITGSIGTTFLSTPSARRATAKTEKNPSIFTSVYSILPKRKRVLSLRPDKNTTISGRMLQKVGAKELGMSWALLVRTEKS